VTPKVEPGSPVLGSDGVRIGIVAAIEDYRIRLAETCQSGLPDGRDDWFIALALVDHVENGMVWLRSPAAEAVSFEEGSTTYIDQGGME
jgi:hypothetical protein